MCRNLPHVETLSSPDNYSFFVLELPYGLVKVPRKKAAQLLYPKVTFNAEMFSLILFSATFYIKLRITIEHNNLYHLFTAHPIPSFTWYGP